jgi:hypothetical protein
LALPGGACTAIASPVNFGIFCQFPPGWPIPAKPLKPHRFWISGIFGISGSPFRLGCTPWDRRYSHRLHILRFAQFPQFAT